MLAVHVICRAK